MIKELNELVLDINEEYIKTNEVWMQEKLYKKVNLKEEIVRNIYNSEYILKDILNYRSFIIRQNIPLVMKLQKFNIDKISSIETRVKTQNSIELKIKNYIDNHEDGKVPIIKCFNDLFGMRIIYDIDFKHSEIEKFIQKEYPKLKCISAIRGDYIATHIYFRNGKYNFPWELQIWSRKNEKNNKISHKKYKQSYTKWESENKGEMA